MVEPFLDTAAVMRKPSGGIPPRGVPMGGLRVTRGLKEVMSACQLSWISSPHVSG